MPITHARRALSAVAAVALAVGGSTAAYAGATTASSAGTAANAGTTATAGTVRLTTDVLPGLGRARDLGPASQSRRLVVAITVKHDLAALYRAEAALYDPKSPSYHHFVTPAEFRLRYGTPAARVNAIRRFGTAHGLQVVNPDVLYDYVELFGTVAQVEQTFGVQIHAFRDAAGHRFLANLQGPAVPRGLGVDAVLGLETRTAYHLADQHGAAVPTSQPQCAPNPAGTQVCTGGLSPQDLWSAYDQPTDNYGEGQTIGIIGEGQTADVIKALRRFEATRGLPQVPVQVYHTDPGDAQTAESSRDNSGQVEWELDSQASTGMAPHVRQLRMYFGSSLLLTQLTGALVTWANDPAGPLQASASLGACEATPATDILFGAAQRASMAATAQAVMEGRTLFASTGDTGPGCTVATGVNGVQYGPIMVDEYPAVDPNAVGVGGTVLYTDGATQPKRVDEHAWDHTGGGPSHFVAQPGYQSGAGPQLAANGCATDPGGAPYSPGQLCRGVSDVSALSGDMTLLVDGLAAGGQELHGDGYDMVDYDPTKDAYTDHFVEGGTSLSTPLWLGMWARVQAHHTAGNDPQHSLGFANEVLYKLGKNSATYARDFFDVVEGDNGTYPAAPGWDYPTGWGVPDVAHLTQDAGGDSTTAPVSNVQPSGPDPDPIFALPPVGVTPPACSYATWDGSPDATDPTTGDQDDRLDIVESDFGLTPDGKSLRAVITVRNLTKEVPTPWTIVDFQMWWDFGGTTYAADAEVDKTGTVTYTDGKYQVVSDPSGQAGNQYQFVPSPTSTATGSWGSGPNGKIEIDVPLTEIGTPAIGATLTNTNVASAESSGKSAAAEGFLVDLDGPGNDYVLGSITCLTMPAADAPEAPHAAWLVGLGAAVAATAVAVTRRRRSTDRG